MRSLNVEWAMAELRQFIAACERYNQSWTTTSSDISNGWAVDIRSQVPIIQQILERAWPDWRLHLRQQRGREASFAPMLDVSRQGLLLLDRQSELEANLGEAGPSLSASTLHPDVWDAAKAPWRNANFGDAVRAAARSVNGQLQSKVGRKDLSDAKLVGECFSLKAPSADQARLRLMTDDGSDTFKSLHEGAGAFGRGAFMAIRNPLNHQAGLHAEPSEQHALEYLAAFSVLARWITDAEVVR